MHQQPAFPTPASTQYRELAEQRLATRPPVALERSAAELLHELQVHQIELEMQNETLRQSQEALEASRDQFAQRYADLYECAPVGYLTLAETGQIIEANLTAAALLGQSRDQLFGRRFDLFLAIDHRDHWHHGFIRTVRQGTESHADVELQRKEGCDAMVHIICQPRDVDSDGRVTVRLALTDISERMLAEAEIRRLNSELEWRVAERTAELHVRNRELDSFAYAVSHDLRAPLRAMNGFSQALMDDYGDSLPAEGHAYLEHIIRASLRMSELIDGLLLLSRNSRGDLKQDTIDLSAMAQRLLQELAHATPEQHVYWEVEAGMSVQGDPRMIEVLLQNLLGNAWKFTGKTANPNIHVYSEVRDGVRRYCVADNGAGFDAAHASHLFQPFQRLHRQDEFPGLGIGLATVQRIVHRHGGTITGQSEVGQGAVFCFTLPGMPGETTPE